MTFFPGFDEFKRNITSGTDLPATLKAGIIGQDVHLPGQSAPMLYADYVASGRALQQIETFVADRILPFYANSHTEGSACGGAMTRLREEARQEIGRITAAGDDCSVVFTGPGATTGINKVVHLFGIRRRWPARRVTVLIGPYEHHSNILPWRECGARVVEIPEGPQGGPDMDALDRALARARGPVVGSFSAMSNVTGLLTDVEAVTRRLKAAGALAIWDYAGAGPYLPMTMRPAKGAEIDAIVTSPHKFIGGPGASGVLIVRNASVRVRRPSMPGGGTVVFVSPEATDYSASLCSREEGGTPNVVGDIRAGLVFAVKEALGQEWIESRNDALWLRAQQAFAQMERVELLGNAGPSRVPILSFRVHHSGGIYHHNLTTKVLSDVLGIQARGGCACAGPYVLRLMGEDAASTATMRVKILNGDALARPGFVRLNLSYLMTDVEVQRVLDGIAGLPDLLDRCAQNYAPRPGTATFDRVEQPLAAE